MMKKTKIFILAIFLSPVYLFAQQKCNCEENFKWAKETFEKNDAGFEYAIQQKGKYAYERHNDTILAKIKMATSKEECANIMYQWLMFFRKAHLSITMINNAIATNDTSHGWETMPISADQIKKHLSKTNNASFEGIWQTGAYTIGIIKVGNGYKGLILTSSNNAWKPNQLKLSINKDSSSTFYMGDFSPQKFDKATLIGKNTLHIGFVYLNRIYPTFQDDKSIVLYVKELSTDIPFIEKISDKSVLLRIPTFNALQKRIIDSVITANDQLLKTTDNLIIDIRNNGGGSDGSYNKIIPYLYTNPIRGINVELYSTPLNNQRMMDFYNHPHDYGITEEERIWAKSSYDLLSKHLGEFVNIDSGQTVSILKLDTIFPLPKNVAIIVNQNNGSTAEQFLLAARQSKKVKLFGVTTAGVLDISNMYFVNSPSNEFKLGYSLSRSLRIPDMSIDNKGIIPDYYIDKSISDKEWLSFVQNILEN